MHCQDPALLIRLRQRDHGAIDVCFLRRLPGGLHARIVTETHDNGTVREQTMAIAQRYTERKIK